MSTIYLWSDLTLGRPRLGPLRGISLTDLRDKLSLVLRANSCILDFHFYSWKKIVAKLSTALGRTQAGEGQGLPGGWWVGAPSHLCEYDCKEIVAELIITLMNPFMNKWPTTLFMKSLFWCFTVCDKLKGVFETLILCVRVSNIEKSACSVKTTCFNCI